MESIKQRSLDSPHKLGAQELAAYHAVPSTGFRDPSHLSVVPVQSTVSKNRMLQHPYHPNSSSLR